MRTQMLSLFCMAVPLGSGLGYIISSNLSKTFNDWHWSLRFTPFISFVCIILLIVFVKEPKRGAAEKLVNSEHLIKKSSLISDIIYLIKKFII
jgi:cyanate permease